MFNLESAISIWRKQMLADGIQSPVPLDELESHLRDDIAHQIKSGLSEETAFNTAAQKIGKAATLQNEFAKADETKYARPRKFIRFFCQAFAGLFLLWCVFGLTHVPLTAAQKISGFIAAGLSALIWANMSLFYRWSPIVPGKNKREWLQAACTLFCPLVGGIVFRVVVPQLELSIGQLAVLVLWSLVPAGIFMGFAYGMGAAARRQLPKKKINGKVKYA